MKIVFIVIINLTLFFSVLKSSSQNVFSESNNIIELNAIKMKDNIQQNKSQMPLYKKDGWVLDNIFPNVTGIPDTLFDVSAHFMFFNFNQALLQAYNAKLIKKEDFDIYFKNYNLGTTEYINKYVKTFVVVIKGKSANNENYYMIDSNNDFDFSNEISIPFNSGEQTKYSHKVQYERVIDNKIKKEYTWISLISSGDEIMFHFDEYTMCEFQVDSIKYEIISFPSRGRLVNYGSACFFKIKNNANSTIQERNYNEFIELNNIEYRITCSEDGLMVRLLKETKVNDKGSTQYGKSPFTFKAVSLIGDTIHFPADFKNKIVLLDFWSTSCGPCVFEMKNSYIDLYEKHGNDKFEIIGVANNLHDELSNFIEKNNIKWIIVPDGKDKLIQKLYNIHQYPTLFLINNNGKIVAKGSELRGENIKILLNEYINIE